MIAVLIASVLLTVVGAVLTVLTTIDYKREGATNGVMAEVAISTAMLSFGLIVLIILGIR